MLRTVRFKTLLTIPAVLVLLSGVVNAQICLETVIQKVDSLQKNDASLRH